jgi:hypothetical protein
MSIKSTYRVPIFVSEVHGRGTALDPGAVDEYMNFIVHDLERTIEKSTDIIEIAKVAFYGDVLRISLGIGWQGMKGVNRSRIGIAWADYYTNRGASFSERQCNCLSDTYWIQQRCS